MSFHLVAGALLALALTYLGLAAEIVLDPWSALDAVNSRTLPQIYGLMLCGAVGALWLRRARRQASSGDQKNSDSPSPTPFRLGLLTGLSALILGFILALPWLNLWLALVGLLFGLLWMMGERRWPALLLASLGLPAAGFLLVEQLLQMSLPIS